MDRRTFLQMSSGTLAMLLAGCTESGDGTGPTVSRGNWGATPSGQDYALPPLERRPEGMLEIFLLGGLSPWETFYTMPQHGNPLAGGPHAGSQWWAFQEGVSPTVSEWFEQCDGTNRDLVQPFGLDAAGQMVNLGPFIYPLRDRPDILSRMRVWVMTHSLEPHAVAIPLAVSGLPISNPRMAGLGTHIQRYFNDRASAERTAPFSYAIFLNSLNRADLGAPATALGLHPASAQPIGLQLGEEPILPRQLPRPGVAGYTSELDALVNHYTAAFRARLRQRGADTRAPGLGDYLGARNALASHEALEALLPAHLFARPEIDMCSRHPAYHNIDVTTAFDETGSAMQIARHLLTAGPEAARYVQVMDGGIYPNANGQGYDTHDEHVLGQGANVSHMCRRLAEIINEPGEDDPEKLDLDRHFVLLNTEFGRSPFPEISTSNPNGFGSNHWPWAYVVVGFGGPVDEERAGVVGAIGEDAYSIEATTPSEHRAAMLMTMGIWPFTEESFAVGNVREATTELDATLRLKRDVLGYES